MKIEIKEISTQVYENKYKKNQNKDKNKYKTREGK